MADAKKKMRGKTGIPGSLNKEKAKNISNGLISDIRYGRSISLDTFRRNVWLLVPFLAVILALMGLRYKTKSRMEQIKTLTTELQRAESTKLQEKAQYMSLVRETEMLKMVEEKELGLVFREDPPIIVTRVNK